MPRISRSRSPTTCNRSFAVRTRDPLAQKGIITPVAGVFVFTQADRCPFYGCINNFSHQHSIAEGKIAPSVDEYRQASEAVRERWTEEQRRQINQNEAMLRRLQWTDEQRHRIAKNEEVLRQLAGLEPKVGSLSMQTYLPRGNDLAVQEQIAMMHGGGTPAQYAETREMILEQKRQDVIDNTSPISPVYPGVEQTKVTYHTQAEQTYNPEYDDFPELDAQYAPPPAAGVSEKLDATIGAPPNHSTIASCDARKGTATPFDIITYPFLGLQNADSLNTNPPCTSPCQVQTPHRQGSYLQQGQVPRVWNPQ